jgi:hypothetical protein
VHRLLFADRKASLDLPIDPRVEPTTTPRHQAVPKHLDANFSEICFRIVDHLQESGKYRSPC